MYQEVINNVRYICDAADHLRVRNVAFEECRYIPVDRESLDRGHSPTPNSYYFIDRHGCEVAMWSLVFNKLVIHEMPRVWGDGMFLATIVRKFDT